MMISSSGVTKIRSHTHSRPYGEEHMEALQSHPHASWLLTVYDVYCYCLYFRGNKKRTMFSFFFFLFPFMFCLFFFFVKYILHPWWIFIIAEIFTLA